MEKTHFAQPFTTQEIEDKYLAPFGTKFPVSIERGEGVYVWDELGKKYIDFTAGWGVTCLGHAHPAIQKALCDQGKKIIQNPESWLTYSPARAKLLALLAGILPGHYSRFFFSNSGAEANDAAIKLARKASGRKKVISTRMSFHGRTISTMSATGQADLLAKFKPLMPDFEFVPFNDIEAMGKAVDKETAAVIIEPIQGEGGVNVPGVDYYRAVAGICHQNGAYFIADEIQTGFWRTGPIFATDLPDVKPDILTMAKGIAGGFPFAAFAMTAEVAGKLEKGDHGGSYIGNPLGCAVSYAVITTLLDMEIWRNVEEVGAFTIGILKNWQSESPEMISDVRGKGLLIALELADPSFAASVQKECLSEGLLLNLKHGNVFRIFPALNITRREMSEGLSILKKALDRL